MEATMKWDKGSKQFTTDGSESSLWEQVGKQLLTINVPNTVLVEQGGEHARLDIKKRGEFVKDGMRLPSMYVVPVFNYIHCTPSKYDEAYLRCVNPEGNNYKFYRLLPINSGDHTVSVDAEYGSIDTDTCPPRRLKDPYEPYLYWIRYYEKLSKGYVDHTKFQCGSAKEKTGKKKQQSSTSDMSVNAILYRELMAYAHKVVKESLQRPDDLTVAQVKEARREYEMLCRMKTYKGFNKHLIALLALSPRNTGNRALGHGNPMISLMPKEFHGLAKEKEKELQRQEMDRILRREENLLMAMEAVVGLDDENAKTTAEDVSDSFKQFGIHIWEATDKQRAEVMSHLTPALKAKVDKIYRVKPEKQEKRFHDYCKRHHIHEIRKFWHGSSNENWASIVENSLRMSPAAHGRMFGDGHYFAPSADKSWGYTSYHGTRWVHGHSDVAFMGLYATAYGNPWMVTTHGRQYTKQSIQRAGYDCVYAAAQNTGLHADEVIFYDDDAICMNYLVKFK